MSRCEYRNDPVNSHVVYQVAQTLPSESADVAVILMGNNEVVGPYGPGTFNQNFLSSLSAIRALQALKRTRLWQLLDSSLAEVQSSDAKADLSGRACKCLSTTA